MLCDMRSTLVELLLSSAHPKRSPRQQPQPQHLHQPFSQLPQQLASSPPPFAGVFLPVFQDLSLQPQPPALLLLAPLDPPPPPQPPPQQPVPALPRPTYHAALRRLATALHACEAHQTQ